MALVTQVPIIPSLKEEAPRDEGPDPEDGERYEFQVEDDVSNFKDKASIPHNEYPETDDDEDVYRRDIKRGDVKLYDNQQFINGVAFKEAVLDYALRTGRNIQQTRWDKTKIEYKCLGDGCSWRIYCALSGESPLWRVRIYNKAHTCVPNGECAMVKVPVIARLFVDKIWEEPSYYLPAKMVEVMKERWKISVSRPQYQSARNKALSWINREYAEQFSRLRDYAAELELTNEGTTVKVETIMNDAEQDVFNRFYVCGEARHNSRFHKANKDGVNTSQPTGDNSSHATDANTSQGIGANTSQAPVKKTSQAPAKKTSSTSANKRSSTPAKNTSAPLAKKTPTPTKKTSAAPAKKTATPTKKTSAAPAKKTATPTKKTSAAPATTQAGSTQLSQPSQASEVGSSQVSQAKTKTVWKKGKLISVNNEPKSPNKKKGVTPKKKIGVDHLSFHCTDLKSNLG